VEADIALSTIGVLGHNQARADHRPAVPLAGHVHRQRREIELVVIELNIPDRGIIDHVGCDAMSHSVGDERNQ
jgi:hypothetical protein